MIQILALIALSQCPPPTGTLTIVPNAGTADANGNKLPRVTWSVSCPPQSTSCPNTPSASLGDLRTEFAAMPSERLGNGTGFSGATGEGPLPGQSSAVIGAHLQFSALVECNNPGSSVRLTSAPVAFAPVLNVGAPLAFERSEADSPVGVFPFDAIPAARRVELRPSFGLELAPNEAVTVRVKGPGVDWSKAYTFANRARSTDVQVAFRDDPTARFTFTGPGPATVSMELAGARSVDATYTIVAGGAGGGAGGSGGGSGGGTGASGGGGSAPRGGCSTAPGLCLAVAVLTVLGRRSARQG